MIRGRGERGFRVPPCGRDAFVLSPGYPLVDADGCCTTYEGSGNEAMYRYTTDAGPFNLDATFR